MHASSGPTPVLSQKEREKDRLRGRGDWGWAYLGDMRMAPSRRTLSPLK